MCACYLSPPPSPSPSSSPSPSPLPFTHYLFPLPTSPSPPLSSPPPPHSPQVMLTSLPTGSTLTRISDLLYRFTWALPGLGEEEEVSPLQFYARDSLGAVGTFTPRLEVCACESGGECTLEGVANPLADVVIMTCICNLGEPSHVTSKVGHVTNGVSHVTSCVNHVTVSIVTTRVHHVMNVAGHMSIM